MFLIDEQWKRRENNGLFTSRSQQYQLLVRAAAEQLLINSGRPTYAQVQTSNQGLCDGIDLPAFALVEGPLDMGFPTQSFNLLIYSFIHLLIHLMSLIHVLLPPSSIRIKITSSDASKLR